VFYLDTSVAASLFIPDVHSATALNWLRGQTQPDLKISSWTRAEFAGVVARLVRMNRMKSRAADAAIEDFKQWSSANCEIIVPTAADFDTAINYVRDYATGLRAPDALHLAIANNWGSLRLASFDSTLNAAAARVGIALAKI
jgi:hypothetical protein